MITSLIALFAVSSSTGLQDCPVTAPGTATQVAITELDPNNAVYVLRSGAPEQKITKVPFALVRGDKIRTAGKTRFVFGPLPYSSSVWMKGGVVTLVGETESIDKLATWDLCPESGSYLVDEDRRQVDIARRFTLSGGFLNARNRRMLIQPVAFRRRSVRLYSVGTQYSLTVVKSATEVRWDINLTAGSVAFERDGYEVYRQPAPIKFSAVVTEPDEFAIRRKAKLTQADRNAILKRFENGIKRLRTMNTPEVRVTNPTGLLVGGVAATKDQLIKASEIITAKSSGGNIRCETHDINDHEPEVMTLKQGFSIKYLGHNASSVGAYDFELQSDTGSVLVSHSPKRLRPPTPVVIWPVLFARRSVRLYSVATDYSLTVVDNDHLSLLVNKDKVITWLDTTPTVRSPRSTPYNLFVPN